MAKEIAEEYTSSLADLTLNSKPLINMLTMLADDNIEHAEVIVEAVEKHLEKVRSEYKLPVLYLIDSIVKNVGNAYTTLFTNNIVNTFCSVFEKVDEKVRSQMFKLRQTWNEVFPAKKLYTLDVRVQCIDPAWPITAPQPTLSIHVNPKFFNKPAVPAPNTVIPAKLTTMDSATLDMQTQLINKQKELLELKQKKLELELLQAKAKLEEQQKQLERQSVQVKPPQSLLLKPEVAKQLVQTITAPGAKTEELNASMKLASQVVQAGVRPVSGPSVGLRIAPVNRALLASVRPVPRDPRLQRKQEAPISAASGVGAPLGGRVPPSVAVPPAQIPTQQNISNNFETVNIDDKQKVKSKSHITTITIDCASSTDKTSVNKAGAQTNTLNRKDPRLLSNKVQGSSAANKNKSNNGRPVSNERLPSKIKTSPVSPRKSKSSSSSASSSSSSSRSFKNSGPVLHSNNNSNKAEVTGASGGGDGAAAGSSISSKSVKDIASVNKGSSDSASKSSPASSPNKYKKKAEHSSPRSDKSVPITDQKVASQKRAKNSTSNKSRSRERLSADKYDDDSIRTVSPAPTTLVTVQQQRTFKGLKGAAKNRNYMRRNRTVSISPEPSQDVDLRVGAPPEKQPRFQAPVADAPQEEAVKNTTVDDSPSSKDVDLRTLVVPATINKKRPSTEKLEATNAKKSKSQIFDVLFGNEDVDLRQLPPVLPTPAVPVTTQAAARPPTPPPPIISTLPAEKPEIKDAETRTKAKDTTKSNFDAIREKLAKATKISALGGESRKITSEDTDMRVKSNVFSSESAEDVLQKIIISKDDEQLIRNGDLSQALVERVLTLFETQKLQEAQRRESEEVNKNDFGNTTLTPISDDELSVDFSHSDSEDDSKTTKKSDVFGDTDERIPPPAPVISQNSNSTVSNSCSSSKPAVNAVSEPQKVEPNVSTHSAVDTRQTNSRIGLEHTTWHGGHHRRRRPKTHWDSPPPPHPGPDPWLRPPAVLNQQMYAPRRPFPPFIRPPVESFGPRIENPVPVIPSHVLESTRTASPPTIGSQNTKELPMADPLVLEYIEQDTMRTINIDGRPREIRYYDETAIVIMSWDDPREISFQNGTRLVTFDDKESFTLQFNDGYRDVTIGGKPHKIRLGAPTRELYIDGKWYECFFGGPGIGIEIDGKMRVVKMDGPPPHVKIGTVKRTDLVAGKINLIIDARTMVPVFLDAKPQKFDIEGKIHTLRFVDALRTVLINEVPFKVEFGGLPKPITVHDKKHFIRFSVLPRGIKPGYVNIANMEGQRFPSPPRVEKENSNDAPATFENPTVPSTVSSNVSSNMSSNEPALPMMGKRRLRPADNESPDNSSRNSPIMQNSSLQQLGSLDVLSSIITSPMANTSTNVSGYQVENTQDSQDGFPTVNNNSKNSGEIPGISSTDNAVPAPVPFLPTNININELFQKLVASGIVTSVKEKTPPPQKPKEDAEPGIKPVLFTQPETLKVRQPPLIAALYSGMQCSSCGVRFPPEHSMQYSQHLDWHFRQNRRGRNSVRKALCRKWYYDVSDWKNFEEIEDIEEREKNWFESQQQQQQAEGACEDGDEEIEIPSVPADSAQDTRCEVCHDKFEQFYNQEKEEWHLRMAIRVDDKTYHPLCYDDYKASLVDTTLDESVQNTTLSDANDTSKEKTNEPLSEENQESKEENPVPDNEINGKKEMNEPVKPEMKGEEEDDDVVIEEPHIEQIEIDDQPDETESDGLKTEKDFMGGIVIKKEPLDDDVEICIGNIKTELIDPEMEHEESMVNAVMLADTTHTEMVSSIDGNVQMSSGLPISAAGPVAGKIKINITKPILAAKESTSSTATAEPEPVTDVPTDSNEPLPPGEEPVQLNLKPALQGLTLTKRPPVNKGTELTGLCSIM